MRWPTIFFKARKPREESVARPDSQPVMVRPRPASDDSPATQAKALPASPAPMVASIETEEEETSFILPPKTSEAAPPVAQPALAPLILSSVIHVRRKAKLTDVARVLIPVPPDKPGPPPAPESGSSAVLPPSFNVATPTGSVIEPKDSEPLQASAPTEVKPAEFTSTVEPVAKEEPPKTETSTPVPEPEKKPDMPPASAPTPETSQPTSSAPSAAPLPITQINPSASSQNKTEFLLVNGERILGHVLSETADSIYLEHSTLGVLTLSRAQIAKCPVEIILLNGDRIVGDIMAETPDTLYVRHTSLGMLTVPRAQRSTRVVEAILKDGDRILGEVLAETESFTLIRSATLGTVTVPHHKVAMINRKIEQIEMKALPPSAPELKDKS